MGFWDWAVAAYRRPGVEGALLALQDAHGQCVVYLLWAAWAARDGRSLDGRALFAGSALASRWEGEATGPLRQARRALKASYPPVGDAAREALREKVRGVEFDAERLLMETLERMTPAPAGLALPLGEALTSACAAWPTGAPLEALDDLAARLD
jgi:uncharacterized protein (TIGR02444 family)